MDSKTKIQKAYEYLLDELKNLRTGHATTLLVEDVMVEHYGASMSVKSLANISTPDGKTIVISPWDPTAAAGIEKAIREDTRLDLNPLSDGKNIHINVPPLTTERRERLVKQVHEKVEHCYIALRNIRHEEVNRAKRQLNDKEIGEDEYHRLEKQVSGHVDEFRQKVETAAAAKEAEITTI